MAFSTEGEKEQFLLRSSPFPAPVFSKQPDSTSSLTWDVQEYPYHNKSTFLSMAFCNLLIYFKLHKSMT